VQERELARGGVNVGCVWIRDRFCRHEAHVIGARGSVT
jgi:hypothetical protein